MKVSIQDPDAVRSIKDDSRFESAELLPGVPNGHKYSPGQTCLLGGLEDYSEYNGERVEITAIRQDGPHGRAYYIRGRINELVNWVYEYRLSPADESRAKQRDEAFAKFCGQHVRIPVECEAFIAGWDASDAARLSTLKLSFMECDSCRRKAGSPVLCESCQHNRAMIERATIALVKP
jgi:hypothetical protein